MDQQMVVERLNDLLELELRGLPARLNEVQSFVDWADAAAVPVFEQIVADEREHQRQLTEEIVRLGGLPRPRALDMTSARVHYLGLRYLLPLLIDNKRQRVTAYEQVAAETSSDSEVSETVGEILSRHQTHLERLEKLAERLAPTGTDRPAPAAKGDDA